MRRAGLSSSAELLVLLSTAQEKKRRKFRLMPNTAVEIRDAPEKNAEV